MQVTKLWKPLDIMKTKLCISAVQGAETGYWYGKQVRNPVVIRDFSIAMGQLPLENSSL